MTDSELIDNLNKLVIYSEIDNSTKGNSNKYFIDFCQYIQKIDGYVNFKLSIAYASLYYDVLKVLFHKGSISRNYVYKTIDKELQKYLFNVKYNEKFISESSFSKFFNGLNTANKERYIVFHKIYGVNIVEDSPIKVGHISLYNFQLHKKTIAELSGYNSIKDFLVFHNEFKEYNYWISTDVECIDVNKAYEIATNRFEVFQGICQFTLSCNNYADYAISVYEDVYNATDACYLISKNKTTSKSERKFKGCKILDINELITEDKNLFFELTERLINSDTGEILNRIRNSFVNYGRSIFLHSKVQKLVNYVITIESLIEFDSDNLSQSLSKYISAVISNDDYELYSKIKSDFEIVYKQRSRIIHGDEIDIMDGDVEFAKDYADNLLYMFVKDNNIWSLNKNMHLKNYLENKVMELEKSNE